MPRLLFAVKHRPVPYSDYTDEDYSQDQTLSSGLFNSVRFVVDALNDHHVEAKVVILDNYHQIDKAVHDYRPTHVIVEALWVVPEKFEILTRLHPKVKWIIRDHSEVPFLAAEGMAMDWISKYTVYPNVHIGCNNRRTIQDIRAIIQNARPELTEKQLYELVVYLPNCYPLGNMRIKHKQEEDGVINIICPGAIRFLKNQLSQAVAAINFANDLDLHLRYHINYSRVETKSSPVLKNIRQLFENSVKHTLVEHEWMPHHRFLKFLRSMDMGLQVSFTETFNIVSADMVSCGLPIVVSREVEWASSFCKADPNNIHDIVKKMKKVWWLRDRHVLQKLNQFNLRKYVNESIIAWKEYVHK